MRVVFMGTPAFAATILDDLAEHHDVAAVYTCLLYTSDAADEL